MKTIFLSFANSVYVPSLRRLEEQIRCCPLINEFHFLTNKDLDNGFKKHFHPYIYRRGYGYWKWKSYLAKQQFDKMEMVISLFMQMLVVIIIIKLLIDYKIISILLKLTNLEYLYLKMIIKKNN